MRTAAVRTPNANNDVTAGKVDMKLEVVAIPVSDVERAKAFYEGLGWRLDADFTQGGGRVIQFTPPGSECSVHFGTNITPAAPGSAQGLFLIVSDIQAARAELVRRGVAVSEVFHFTGFNRVDPARTGERPRAGAAAATGRSCRSATRMATGGWSRRSRRDCPAGSIPRRPRLVRRAIWRAPSGARRPPTASTRSAPGSETRTGPTGTPRTWRPSGPARRCRREPARGRGELPF